MLLKLFILTFIIVAASSLKPGFEMVWKKPAGSCERGNSDWMKFFPAVLAA